MTKIRNAEWVLQQQKSKKKFFIFLNSFSQHRTDCDKYEKSKQTVGEPDGKNR